MRQRRALSRPLACAPTGTRGRAVSMNQRVRRGGKIRFSWERDRIYLMPRLRYLMPSDRPDHDRSMFAAIVFCEVQWSNYRSQIILRPGQEAIAKATNDVHAFKSDSVHFFPARSVFGNLFWRRNLPREFFSARLYTCAKCPRRGARLLNQRRH